MQTVELINIVLLVAKKNGAPLIHCAKKHVPSLQNYVHANCPVAVPMLFKCFGITI